MATARKFNQVRLRGLPYRVTEREVADWLRVVADPISVTILLEDGRPTGEAECLFDSAKVAKRVIQTMHKKEMGHRYIECFFGGGGAHKFKQRPSTPKPASIPWPEGSSMLQDCYFYQIKECEKKLKCPFLHRTIPGEVCKLFLFKRCKRYNKCPKQHISPLCLPAHSKEEEDRLRSVRKSRWKECLDCEAASTSCLLLENHLNSEEHRKRIKQIKIEGKEIKGVIGNKPDIWSEKDERDFIAARREEKANNLFKDIHIRDIPFDITMPTFRKICMQFGELSSLKLLPMPEADTQHAYIRYTTENVNEFAFRKLRELQKCEFAGISLLLHDRPWNDVSNARDENNATNFNEEKILEDMLHLKIKSTSDQLLKVTSAKEEEESKLLLCTTRKKICQLNGAGPEETLKLDEEELQIQRSLRDFECAVEQAEKELDNLKNCQSSGSRSKHNRFLKLKSERNPDVHCDLKIRKGEDCSVGKCFRPGDKFNSDDEDDVDVIREEMRGLKLGIQNMMSSKLSKEKQDKTEEDVIECSKPIVRKRIA